MDDDSSVNEVFILGSGFSKALNNEMPSLTDLSGQALRRFKENRPNAKSQQINHLEDVGIAQAKDNIELLLSYLSTNSPWLDQEEILRNRASFIELSKIIGEIITEKEIKCFPSDSSADDLPDCLKKLVHYWHQNQSDVITLNYDTIIERFFSAHSLTDDEEGYSPPYAVYPIYLTPLRKRKANRWMDAFHIQYRDDTFKLYKIHGSTNFYYSGLDSFPGEEILYVDPADSNLGDIMDREDLTHGMVPLIVPPVMEKSEFYDNLSLKTIWGKAHRKVKEADKLIFIGYAFPTTDMTMRFFFSNITNGESPENSHEIKLVNIDHPEGSDDMTEYEIQSHYAEMLDKETLNIDTYFVLPEEEKPVETFANSLYE